MNPTLPTAKQSLGPEQATPFSSSKFDGLGVPIMIVQRLPFQCSINVRWMSARRGEASPTAKQLDVVGHDTPQSSLAANGLDACTIDHRSPFHRSMSASCPSHPTAKQRVALGHVTSVSVSNCLPERFGLDMTVQLVPSQCSTSVFVSPGRVGEPEVE